MLGTGPGLAHLEGVTLVNKVLLPFGRVVHLGGIRADKRIEERVEATVNVGLYGHIYYITRIRK